MQRYKINYNYQIIGLLFKRAFSKLKTYLLCSTQIILTNEIPFQRFVIYVYLLNVNILVRSITFYN